MKHTISLIDSQFADWEFFDCGDPRVTTKLQREAQLADRGFQKLYGAFVDPEKTQLVGVLTIRAGQLEAPPQDVARLAGGTGITIPTLHIEALAVRVHAQRQGAGEQLIGAVNKVAEQVHARVGLYTISLEATPASVPFYTRLGFDASNEIYPDGTRAMWLIL